MKDKKVVKITNESIKNMCEVYKKSNEHGDLINKFISIFKKDKQADLIKAINKFDNNLYKRTNLLQRVVLNGIVTTMVLKFKNDHDDVFINNIIYQCNSLYNDDVWLNSMKELVVPFLLDNKII